MKKIVLLLLALILLAPAYSYAAPKCKAKKNHTFKYDSKRKSCTYKQCKAKKGFKLSVKSNKCTYAAKTKWKLSSNTDSVTGESYNFAFVNSQDGVSTMFVVCRSGKLDWIISYGKFLTFSNPSVSFNIDGSYFSPLTWDGISSGDSTTWPFFLQTGTIVDLLIGRSSIVVRAVGLVSSIDMYFDLNGAGDSIRYIRGLCPNQSLPFS